jgi:hypothetical protein
MAVAAPAWLMVFSSLAFGLLGLRTGQPGSPAWQGLAGGDLASHLGQLAAR